MANIKKTEDSRSDFAQGTLVGVTATNEGSLELAFTTTKIDKVETTSADFNGGTLSKLQVTSGGSLQLGLDGSDVSHTDNFLEGSLSGAVLAAGDITLHKGVDVAYTEAFDGVLTDVEIKNGQLTLQPSGVTMQYNETSKADFEAGTLSNVVASLVGDLELARDAETTNADTTNADFNTGTLTNVVVADNSISADYSSTTFTYSDPAGTQQLVKQTYEIAQTENFATGTLNNVEVDGSALKLAKETSIFTHQEDFKTGILDNTIATDALELDGGDLILKNETVEQAFQDSTQAHFMQGALTGLKATADGLLQLEMAPNDSDVNNLINSEASVGTYFTPNGIRFQGDAFKLQEKATNFVATRRVAINTIQTGIRIISVVHRTPSDLYDYYALDNLGNFRRWNTSKTIPGGTNYRAIDINKNNGEIYVVNATHINVLKYETSELTSLRTIEYEKNEGFTNREVHGIAYSETENIFWLIISERAEGATYYKLQEFSSTGKKVREVDVTENNHLLVSEIREHHGYLIGINNGHLQIFDRFGKIVGSTVDPGFVNRIRSVGGFDIDSSGDYYLSYDTADSNFQHFYEPLRLAIGEGTAGSITGYLHKSYDVSGIENVKGSRVSWEENIPPFASPSKLEVAFSKDGSTWTLATNGAPIPVLAEGSNLTNDHLYLRVYMQRAGSNVPSPTINNINVNISVDNDVYYQDVFDGTHANTQVVGNKLQLTQETGIGAVKEEVGGILDTNGGSTAFFSSVVKVNKSVKLLGAEQYLAANSTHNGKVIVIDAGTSAPISRAVTGPNVAQASITGGIPANSPGWYGVTEGLNYTLQAGHYYLIGVIGSGNLTTQYRGTDFASNFAGDWGQYIGGLYMTTSAYFNQNVGQNIVGSYGSIADIRHALRLYVEAETTVTAPSGQHISKPIAIDGKVSESSITWTADTPTGTAAFVDCSTDNGVTWTQVSNGGALIPEETVLSGNILLRERLTSNGSATPKVSNVQITVKLANSFFPSGTRIRTLTLDNIDQVTIDWVEEKPADTNIIIETSLDGTTYAPVTNGGLVPNFPENTKGTLYIKQTLTTNNPHVTPKLDELNMHTSATGYLASGNRISPSVAVPTDLVENARISWNETKPAGTTVTIQTSTDNGVTWSTVSNGGTIPNFVTGVRAPSALMIKQVLYTENPDVSPRVHDVTVTVDEYKYKTSGSRISVAKDISSVRVLASTTLTVAKTTPTGTTAKVEVSTDNVSWTEVTSTLGLTAGQNLAGKNLYVRQTLTTTDAYKTPAFTSMSYRLDGYEYGASRTYASSTFTITQKGVADTATISWNETKPAGTNVNVSLVLPNGTKVPVANNTSVAELIGQSMENATMRFEAELSTTNIANTPTVSSLRVSGTGKRYDKTATRIAPSVALNLASVANTQIVWNADVSVGSIVVDTSIDGGATWQRATNGGTIGGIAKGDNVSSKSLLVKTTIVGGITGSPKLHDIAWNVSGGFLPSGTRETDVFSLQQVGLVKNSTISWLKTEPAGTSARVYLRVSTNGGVSYGEWTEPTNGGVIPGVISGVDATDIFIQLKQVLTTTDVAATPQIHSLAFDVESGFESYGTHVSKLIAISPAEVAAGSLITFDKVTPSGTTAQVEARFSHDNGITWGDWVVVNSGVPIPGLVSGVDLRNKVIQGRIVLSSTNLAVTPSISNLCFGVTAGYQTGGTYVSKPVDISSLGVAAGSQLSWIGTTPIGTSITAETTTDNGLSWQVVTNGGQIPYVGGKETLKVRFTLNSTDLTKAPVLDSMWFNISTGYSAEGVRTSPVYQFEGAGKVSSSRIRWNATTPVNTAVIVETSIDNGFTWQIATNGYIIPGIVGGSTISERGVMIRQTLKTNNTMMTPVLNDVTLTIEGGGFKDTGYRISPPIALDTAGTVSGNEVTWIATEPAGTAIEVQAAITGSSATVPDAEQFRPIVVSSRSQMGENRYEYFGTIEQIVNETDMSGLYLWIKEILTTEDVN